MTTSPTTAQKNDPITGTAAGVPFLALPPVSAPSETTPVVVAWHLMDAPRSEAALAAALPLDGLDAWRVYVGLPMLGSRLPAGGFEEFMRLGAEDAVRNLHGPVWQQAAEEFPAAYEELRERLGLGVAPIGVLGGSIGAAIALRVIADAHVPVAAAVLVSPMIQLRAVVDALSEIYEVTYPWAADALDLAARIDFVARSSEIASGQPAVQLLVGADDHVKGFQRPAAALRDALAAAYDDSDRVELVTISDMGHALAEEPGMEPAPQLPHAAEVDRHAVRWFRQHLAAD